jgi:hypothetical protein
LQPHTSFQRGTPVAVATIERRAPDLEESMARTGFHIVLGILLWVVFGYYWYIVFQRPITPHTRLALIIVSAIVVSISLFLVCWIFHNRRIARRHLRRRTRTEVTKTPELDFLGRKFINIDDRQLKRAPYVEVHVIEMTDKKECTGHKVYRIADTVPE